MDVGEDAGDVVGAEAGGERWEARVGGFGWDCVFELAAVAEEDLDDFEEEGDVGGLGPFLLRSGVWGWFGGLRRLVHGGVTNINC